MGFKKKTGRKSEQLTPEKILEIALGYYPDMGWHTCREPDKHGTTHISLIATFQTEHYILDEKLNLLEVARVLDEVHAEFRKYIMDYLDNHKK
jgi:hypothetical protein